MTSVRASGTLTKDAAKAVATKRAAGTLNEAARKAAATRQAKGKAAKQD